MIYYAGVDKGYKQSFWYLGHKRYEWNPIDPTTLYIRKLELEKPDKALWKKANAKKLHKLILAIWKCKDFFYDQELYKQ